MNREPLSYYSIVSSDDVWMYMHITEVASGRLKTYGVDFHYTTKLRFNGDVDDTLEDEVNDEDVDFTEEEEQAFEQAADEALANLNAMLDRPPTLDSDDGQCFTENLLPEGYRFKAVVAIYEV